MPRLLETVSELMKLSEDELREKLLDEKYNKANLREIVRQSIKKCIDLERSLEYKKQLEREKETKANTCTACGGSGVYDNFGSPPCGACDGTGYEL